MKWLRTLILFDKGELASGTDWADIHASYVRAIQQIDNPRGSGQLVLRKKSFYIESEKKKWKRNGVGYLRNRFLEHIVSNEGWQSEAGLDLEHLQPTLKLYPSLEPYSEPITSDFGDFDFVTTSQSGIKVAIEWETGNISSSHRSLNKLSIMLAAGKIQAGILIVPSRGLYEQLTDRIGNIGELSPYLGMWHTMGDTVKRGLLAITVVEHDRLTDETSVAYLKTGDDGRAAEGRRQ